MVFTRYSTAKCLYISVRERFVVACGVTIVAVRKMDIGIISLGMKLRAAEISGI